MIFFLYSSPYLYYKDNLVSLAEFLKNQGHEVYASYRLSIDGDEYSMLTEDIVSYSKDFLNNKIKPDYVILTQCWWYADQEISKLAREKNISVLIVDHAPPMIRYIEKNGKKSHQYRKNLMNAQNFYAYGQNTIDIMKKVGCKESMLAVGSARIDSMMKLIKNKKQGYVIFDTSARMEDHTILKSIEKFIQKNPDKEFIIREHSRSSKIYGKLKYSNVSISNESEYLSYEYSDFIFTFPSSAMLIPALLNKNIYAVYKNHYCVEAQEFYKKYKKTFVELGQSKLKDYSEFITNNIVYKRNEETNQRIYRSLKIK